MKTHRRAFSRFDLLGLLAISGTLLCVIVPAMLAARQQSSVDRQISQAKEWVRGWKAYTMDNADAVVIAAAPWPWVHPSVAPGSIRLLPPNPWAVGVVGASTNKTYTLHMLPWVSGGVNASQIDSATRDAFSTRTIAPTSTFLQGGQTVSDYAETARPSAFAWHPSLGYNGVFVGGSFRHGAYQDVSTSTPTYSGTNSPRGGHFYVRRTSQITNANLTIFAPARGGDVASGSAFWSYGQAYPNSGTIRPGHWLITPPLGNTSLATSSWLASTTADGQSFNPARVPSSYGNLDFRIGSPTKTFTASADGAVRVRSLDDLRDMRLWATQATSANWSWTPGQNP